MRTQPFDGATGVTHPILSEAVIRFVSQSMMEIFPASGPVKTKVVGSFSEEKGSQAKRVEGYMNYLLTEEMPEYRNETEQLLFQLSLAGSAFRKVYYDPYLKRPSSVFVPAEDFVVSYSTLLRIFLSKMKLMGNFEVAMPSWALKKLEMFICAPIKRWYL